MQCFLDTFFVGRSECESCEEIAGVSLDAYTPSSARCSVNSCKHSGKSRNRFPDAGMLVSSLRFVAGLDEVSSGVSCCNDVEDVFALNLEEPGDKPGTTIGAKFSVLHWVLVPFWFRCGFLTTGPLM